MVLATTACASPSAPKDDATPSGGGGRREPASGGGGGVPSAAGTPALAGAPSVGGVANPPPGGASGATEPSLSGGPALAGGSGGAPSGGGAGAPASCPQTISLDATAAPLHLPISLVAAGAPLALGQKVVTAGGGAYLPGVVSFFVSEAVLTTATGERVPAHFTDSAGVPRPYDVLLVNASEPSSLALDLRAPAGTYTSLALGIGLPPACNHGDPTQAVFPLNASTGLYWTWATGYMFIRIEGQIAAGDTMTPFTYHVGFDDLYRTVVFAHALTLPSTGIDSRIVLDLDRVMAKSDAAGDLTLASEPEVADRFAAPGTLALMP